MKTLLILILGFSAYGQNVNIPDANFKAYLVGNTAINTNLDTEIQVSEANAFTGSIDCSSLSIADLTGIEEFTDLTILYCGNNQLTELDKEIEKLKKLEVLYLNNNQITKLPGTIYKLKNLYHLDLSDNELIELPSSFGKLKKLEELSLQHNQITKLPSSFGKLKKLEELYLMENKLKSLPKSFNKLSVVILYLQDNRLKKLEDSFFKLFHKEGGYEINLQGNHFSDYEKESIIYRLRKAYKSQLVYEGEDFGFSTDYDEFVEVYFE